MAPLFKSATRMKAHVLVIVCVLLLVIGRSPFVTTAAAVNPATYCAPGQAIKPRQCAARMRKCRAYGAIMKFAGRGCRNSRGKPARDGGCQCSGYCAYSCSKPCVRDRQCYWNASEGACFVRASKAKGTPILNCLPTHGPTTAWPSQEPTMRTSIPTTVPSNSPRSSPSTTPTNTQPSSSPSSTPSTSEPSVTPSQKPSAMPSQSPSQAPSETPSPSPTRGPVSVTCDLSVYQWLSGIWLDGVDMLSSVTPRGLNFHWSVPRQITFEVDPLSTSQTIAVSGRTSDNYLSLVYYLGFSLVCQSELLVWTFQTSVYENWEGFYGQTFPTDWQTGNGTALRTRQSPLQYCLRVAPYIEGCSESANKYEIIKIRPVYIYGTFADRNEAIRKTVDSSTPNYMMKLGRMVLMPPSTGSRVILYSITNTKSFRITNFGTSGNLCIYNEPSGTVSRCYYGTSSSTLFFFAFSGTTAAGYDNAVSPAAPGIVGTALFTSVTSAGILYLRDDELLCYNNAGALPPTPATTCLLF